MIQEVFDLFRSREPLPFVILAIFCLGWLIIVERFILLQFVYRVNFSKFNFSLRKMLAAGDLERARTYCAATSKTGLPLIAVKAIDAYQTDTFKVRPTVAEEAMAFFPRLRRRISQVPNLATAVVLLGALAAVHGLWQSFHYSAVGEQGIKSFAFTSGLSHSLTPLGLALAGAVLLMVPYGILDAIAARLEGDIEHSLTIILNILAPETNAIVAAPPAVGAASVGGGEPVRGGDEPKMPEMAAAPKGVDDVPVERAEKIPDEEEII